MTITVIRIASEYFYLIYLSISTDIIKIYLSYHSCDNYQDYRVIIQSFIPIYTP